MSDQSKSNFQALGAGLLGFIAVVAVGGGALMLHSMNQRSAAKPAPAAAPIDLAAPVPGPASPSPVYRERRAESPAPLIGDDGQDSIESVPASASPAETSKAETSQAETSQAASALKATAHLDAKGGSTAEAVVRNAAPEEKAPAKGAVKKAAAPKTAVASAPSEAVASVHYGVTDRSELMGRAAGPVYNVKGAGKGASGAVEQAVSGQMNASIAALKKQLENVNLPSEQREAILKQLEAAGEPAAK